MTEVRSVGVSEDPERVEYSADEPGDTKLGPAGKGPKERSGSLWSDAWRELRHNPVFIVCALLVLVISSMAAFPDLWTGGTDPRSCSLAESRQPPGNGYLLGTTIQGCDMYANIIHGARASIIIAVFVTAGTTLIGVAFGTAAGYFGGLTDTLISRFTDIVFGLPTLLGALIFLALIGDQSVLIVAGVLVVLGWAQMTRIMRGSVLSTKSRDYVEAARALGASSSAIIFRHILPNAIQPAIVLATIYLGTYVSAEATLTFLGVGLEYPDISWGILISEGQGLAVYESLPHLLLWPCVALIITVLSFILLGDALRDALDPRNR